MVQLWIIRLAIAFVVRQVLKFGKDTDWTKVKIDADKRIADVLPGSWLDDEAKLVANACIDAVASVLRDQTAIQKFATLITDGKQTEALTIIRDHILSTWIPQTPAQKIVAQTISDKPTLFLQAA